MRAQVGRGRSVLEVLRRSEMALMKLEGTLGAQLLETMMQDLLLVLPSLRYRRLPLQGEQ